MPPDWDLVARRGAQGPQGPVGINWTGEYVPGQFYDVDDGVEYGGSTFIATEAGTLPTPPLLANNTLVTGPTGPVGDAGPTGPIGPSTNGPEYLSPAFPINATQDTANAAALLAAGEPLLLRTGEYRWNGLILPNNATVRGAGQGLSLARNLTGRVVRLDAGGGINLSDLTLQSDSGGNVVDQLGGISQSVWERFGLIQKDDDFSCWDSLGQEMDDFRFNDWYSEHTQTATVPSWKFVSPGGILNDNEWQRGRHKFSGAYAFWLEATTANAFYSDVFKGITFEVCTGGMIRLRGVRHFVIEDCLDWDKDSGAVGMTLGTEHGFDIGAGAGGIQCVGVVRRAQRLAGHNSPLINDLNFVGGAANGSLVEQCENVGIIEPYTVETNGNLITIIYGADPTVGLIDVKSTAAPAQLSQLGGVNAWIPVPTPFLNGWTNSPGAAPFSYRKTNDNRHVEFVGVIQGNAGGQAVTVLPPEFRPVTSRTAASVNGTTQGESSVTVLNDGTVFTGGSTAAALTDQRYMDCIFPVDI